MSKIPENSYIVIQSFMVRELELKGMELLIYAIIFGFSQTENQAYTGSLKYLMDWTQSSKYGVIKSLKSLVDKGLVFKTETYNNGVKFVSYEVNKVDQWSTKLTGGQLSSPNNIDNISITDKSINSLEEVERKKEIKKERKFVPPTLDEVRAYIKERNSPVDPVWFFQYFETGHWIDSEGKPVRNWKQKILTWEKFGNGKSVSSDASKSNPKKFNVRYDNE